MRALDDAHVDETVLDISPSLQGIDNARLADFHIG